VADAASSRRWRYLDLGAQSPYENASTMPVLVRSVHEHGQTIAQTSVWGVTHLNVGWFDDIDATLDLAACRRVGVEVVRRQVYGGGTAFYGAGCAAMWGFLLAKPEPGVEGESLDDRLERFQPVLTDALDRIGLGEVQFEGSSDLRWHGRKLGALTAQDVVLCDSVGGFLNLARPDLDLYLSVVRIPDEKFKDKVVKDLREYVCTAEEVAGHPVSYEDLRDAIVGALTDAGYELEPSVLSEGEQKGFTKIGARISGDEQLRRVSSERFAAEAPEGTRTGFANHKGRKLCRAGVAIDGDGVIVAAMMAGDMHVSPPDAIDRVAGALVGARADDHDDLRARIASVFEADDIHQAEAAMGITTDDLLTAVEKAVAAAGGAVAVEVAG
jgi:lipoate-protein ligase A